MLLLLVAHFLPDFKIRGETHRFADGQQRMQQTVLHDVTANMTKLLWLAWTSVDFHHASDILRVVAGEKVQQRAFAASTRTQNDGQFTRTKLTVEIFQHALIICRTKRDNTIISYVRFYVNENAENSFFLFFLISAVATKLKKVFCNRRDGKNFNYVLIFHNTWQQLAAMCEQHEGK